MNRPIGGEPKPLSSPSSSPNLPPTPRRITVTIPSKLHQELVERSDREGRSLSNLVAFLHETALLRSGRPPL